MGSIRLPVEQIPLVYTTECVDARNPLINTKRVSLPGPE